MRGSAAREMAGDDRSPVIPAVIAAEFEACFQDQRHVVLAVSGGPDSFALMYWAAEWKAARGVKEPEFSVVTVDHGLRPESAAEAAMVAAAAQQVGFAHTTLRWVADKPQTGLQVAAREARYRLMGNHLKTIGCQAIATGHTRDDQAETLLMRLARGSGVDGLAAMRRQTLLDGKVSLLRPLLGVPKADLEAALRARGISWIVDPGNEKAAFERGRIRTARQALDGLGLTSQHLALSAERLGRAREALEWSTADAIGKLGDALHVDDLGFAEIVWHRLLSLPEDIRLRILVRLLGAIGGGGRSAVSLGQLEAMTVGRNWQPPDGLTLAGAVFRKDAGDRLMLTREFGRTPMPEIQIAPGQSVAWDNRFHIALALSAPLSLTVAALGPNGLDQLAKEGCGRIVGARRKALLSVPVLWQGETRVAAPALGYFAKGWGPSLITCQFAARPFPEPQPKD